MKIFDRTAEGRSLNGKTVWCYNDPKELEFVVCALCLERIAIDPIDDYIESEGLDAETRAELVKMRTAAREAFTDERFDLMGARLEALALACHTAIRYELAVVGGKFKGSQAAKGKKAKHPEFVINKMKTLAKRKDADVSAKELLREFKDFLSNRDEVSIYPSPTDTLWFSYEDRTKGKPVTYTAKSFGDALAKINKTKPA